jgi:hypothetical protein
MDILIINIIITLVVLLGAYLVVKLFLTIPRSEFYLKNSFYYRKIFWYKYIDPIKKPLLGLLVLLLVVILNRFFVQPQSITTEHYILKFVIIAVVISVMILLFFLIGLFVKQAYITGYSAVKEISEEGTSFKIIWRRYLKFYMKVLLALIVLLVPLYLIISVILWYTLDIPLFK